MRNPLRLLCITALLAAAAPLCAVTPAELWTAILDHHPDVQAADDALAESRFDLKRALSQRHPEVTGEILATYIANPMEAVVFNSAELLPAGEPTNYQFNLNLTQPIVTWGKISGAISLKEEIGALRSAEKQKLLDELETEFGILLDSLWYTRKMSETVQEQLSIAEEIEKLVSENYRYGTVLHDELRDAAMRVREAQLARLQLDVRLDELELELQRMSGDYALDAGSIDHAPDAEQLLSLDVASLAGREDELLDRGKPVFTLLARSAAAAGKAEEIASGALYWKPDIALQLSLGYSGPDLPLIESGWMDSDDYSFTATVAFSTTLWDGGRRLIDLDQRRHELQQAEEEFGRSEEKLTYAYRRSLLQFSLLQESALFYRDRSGAARESIELRQREFDSGSGTRLDLLSAKSRLYEDQLSFYEKMAELSREYHTLKGLLQP